MRWAWDSSPPRVAGFVGVDESTELWGTQTLKRLAKEKCFKFITTQVYPIAIHCIILNGMMTFRIFFDDQV